MKCRSLALLLLASSFVLTSLPVRAELEDAPLPGDFQTTQPVKSPKLPAPAPQPPLAEKAHSNAVPAAGHAESLSKKQATRSSKALGKRKASLKRRGKATRLKQRAVAARRLGKAPVKAGKKADLAIKKDGRVKYVKKIRPTLRSKAKPAKKARVTSKKPLKIVKKKVIARKNRK